MHEPARKMGYGPVHRETRDIMFVMWTRRDAREALQEMAETDPSVVAAHWKIERVKVISLVK
jgi:hypothetical protein